MPIFRQLQYALHSITYIRRLFTHQTPLVNKSSPVASDILLATRCHMGKSAKCVWTHCKAPPARSPRRSPSPSPSLYLGRKGDWEWCCLVTMMIKPLMVTCVGPVGLLTLKLLTTTNISREPTLSIPGCQLLTTLRHKYPPP